MFVEDDPSAGVAGTAPRGDAAAQDAGAAGGLMRTTRKVSGSRASGSMPPPDAGRLAPPHTDWADAPLRAAPRGAAAAVSNTVSPEFQAPLRGAPPGAMVGTSPLQAAPAEAEEVPPEAPPTPSDDMDLEERSPEAPALPDMDLESASRRSQGGRADGGFQLPLAGGLAFATAEQAAPPPPPDAHAANGRAAGAAAAADDKVSALSASGEAVQSESTAVAVEWPSSECSRYWWVRECARTSRSAPRMSGKVSSFGTLHNSTSCQSPG